LTAAATLALVSLLRDVVFASPDFSNANMRNKYRTKKYIYKSSYQDSFKNRTHRVPLLD
jgi:hypothetical protein